jgi:hypothetical protein
MTVSYHRSLVVVVMPLATGCGRALLFVSLVVVAAVVQLMVAPCQAALLCAGGWHGSVTD